MPPSSAPSRLSNLSAHLSPPPPPSTTQTSPNSYQYTKRRMATSRPPITCHILDTLTGTPAPDVPVTLTLLSPAPLMPGLKWASVTNADGRVTAWSSQWSGSKEHEVDIESVFESTFGTQQMIWVCRFEVQEHWKSKGVEPFFPEVEIRFVTKGYRDVEDKDLGHWHVPLLLGPYSYTTYRGS